MLCTAHYNYNKIGTADCCEDAEKETELQIHYIFINKNPFQEKTLKSEHALE